MIAVADSATGANCIGPIFDAEKPPTAIVAGNDLVLREILSYLKKQKISIPGEVAIVSIDDVAYTEFYEPSITTIKAHTANGN
ncbi:substrate-binding domain-containing protein [Peribacillus sp. NPDC096622]|uniref:substrate-binding domain-containing protein n=1 Tax=Peribacillus sp. NPDC096622 TaxID=3364396 RepID=UPI003800C396